MSAHSDIAPSSMALFMACRAAMRIRKPYLNGPRTPEAMEGDAAHWLALQWAEGKQLAVGTTAPNGVEIDASMVIGAQLWVATIHRDSICEIPVACTRVHAGCWGTPDARHGTGRTPDTQRGFYIIRLWDYKYGHRYVDPFECWQLIPYVSALIDEAIALGWTEEQILIEFCIVQPRSYHRNGPVQYWRHSDGRLFKATEMHAYIEACRVAVEESLQPNAIATVGAHCLDCEGRHACTALQRATTREVVSFAQVAERMDLSSHALGCELALIDETLTLLKARKTGLEVQAEALLRGGNVVTGWNLEPGQSRLKWKAPADEVAALGDALGLELRKPLEIITATQARDRYKLTEATMSAYSERPPAAMKLERIDPNKARKAFGA